MKSRGNSAKRRVRVEVTQKDIDEGRANVRHIKAFGGCVADECPVALALNREVHAFSSVTPAHIRFGKVEIKSPTSVQRFISKFDRNNEVKPFTFTLEIPR